MDNNTPDKICKPLETVEEDYSWLDGMDFTPEKSPEEVPILFHHGVRSWPEIIGKTPKPIRYISIHEAFAGTFWHDAHTVAYVSPKRYRLRNDSIGQVPISMVRALFDIDCGDSHKKAGSPAQKAWQVQEARKVQKLFKVHPGGFIYYTRGGYRLLYTLPQPFPILSYQQARDEWSVRYLTWIAYLKRVFDIAADGACANWDRTFRLPHATRNIRQADGTEVLGTEPERLASYGDLDHLGIWDPPLAQEDRIYALRASGKKVNASGNPIVFEHRLTWSYGGPGVFYYLFKAKGWILRQKERGSWFVECPNKHQHSTDLPKDTLLMGANERTNWGTIHCFHGHCTDKETEDWRVFFTDSEIESAIKHCNLDMIHYSKAKSEGEISLGSDAK